MGTPPDQRTRLITGIAEHQRAAIHCLRLLGDSVNLAGDLPLDGDYLQQLLRGTAEHLAGISQGLGALHALGFTLLQSDLQEIDEEPIPQADEQGPKAAEGGAR